MNKYTQHIPNFVDTGEPPPSFGFETTKQLLTSEIVRGYGKREDFTHFAIRGHLLMQISDNGFHWLVVGYIQNPEEVDLPKWEGCKYRAELLSGKKVVLSEYDIVSSCGDILALRDGTYARDLRG